MDEELFTVEQAAERLNITASLTYKLIAAGQLGHKRMGASTIRVSAAHISAYLQAVDRPAKPAKKGKAA